MKMSLKSTIIAIVATGVIGCSSSDYENYQLFPGEYVSDVEFNSIYHYGYNQGCESALSTKGIPDMDYMKDETLDNSDTKFNAGWDDGNQSCKDGVRRIMPSLKIMASNSETAY